MGTPIIRCVVRGAFKLHEMGTQQCTNQSQIKNISCCTGSLNTLLTSMFGTLVLVMQWALGLKLYSQFV